MTVVINGGINAIIRSALMIIAIIASTLEASHEVRDKTTCYSIKYWDAGISSYEPCLSRCQPGGGLQRECRLLCPGMRKR